MPRSMLIKSRKRLNEGGPQDQQTSNLTASGATNKPPSTSFQDATRLLQCLDVNSKNAEEFRRLLSSQPNFQSTMPTFNEPNSSDDEDDEDDDQPNVDEDEEDQASAGGSHILTHQQPQVDQQVDPLANAIFCLVSLINQQQQQQQNQTSQARQQSTGQFPASFLGGASGSGGQQVKNEPNNLDGLAQCLSRASSSATRAKQPTNLLQRPYIDSGGSGGASGRLFDCQVDAAINQMLLETVQQQSGKQDSPKRASSGSGSGSGSGDSFVHLCVDCGKRYSTSSNLARHRQTHRDVTDKKAKKCPFCGKIYVSMPAFSMHIRTHNQGCLCSVCGKKFSRPWLLQGHMRTHTGEKPFKCKTCGKAFADKSNLRAHTQTHSTTKPFVCRRCNKAFALKSYLCKHEDSTCMRAHAGAQKESRLGASRGGFGAVNNQKEPLNLKVLENAPRHKHKQPMAS